MKTLRSTWITISEEPLLEVEVSAEVSFWKDDFDYAGTHCTGGVGGTHRGGGSCEVYELEYDKNKYTEEEILKIDSYLIKNEKKVKEDIIEYSI
jgi:hypothetical protein